MHGIAHDVFNVGIQGCKQWKHYKSVLYTLNSLVPLDMTSSSIHTVNSPFTFSMHLLTSKYHVGTSIVHFIK